MKRLGIIVLAILVLLGGVGAYAYSRVKGTMDDIYTGVDQDDMRDEDIKLHKDPFSVLLLGIDKDENREDTGRSDTIIIATINPKTKSTIMQSIERDTLVDIAGMGFQDKINHAYAYGGAAMSINTVQNFLDVPIDYYVEIDMDGLKAIIDAVGGVTVNNEQLEFEYGGFYFPIGELNLNGEEALAYTRMRYDDPEGDWGRQKRQRAVIVAIVNKAATFQVSRYDAILQVAGDNMRTNLTMSDLLSISTRYTAALTNIEEYSLYGEGTMIDGVYYLIPDESARLEVSQRLRTHLGLD